MFTLSQLRTLAIVPKVTGTLSLLSSSYIVKDVLQDPKKRYNTYHRIMLGMSVGDIVWSFNAFILGSWPAPNGSRLYALGNMQTCDAQGFVNQLAGLAAPLYNCSLATFYLLMLRYNWNNRKLKAIEPWFHALPWGLGLIAAIIALTKKLYAPDIVACALSIQPYPYGCDSPETCLRAWNSVVYFWAIGVGWLLATPFYVLFTMLMIYSHVRSVEKKSARYKFTAAFQKKKKNNNKSRRVMIQAFLYSGAVFLTWFLFVIMMFQSLADILPSFGMLLSMTILITLQGPWNLMIYLKPQIERWMKNYRKKRIEEKKATATDEQSKNLSSTSFKLPKAILKVFHKKSSTPGQIEVRNYSKSSKKGEKDSSNLRLEKNKSVKKGTEDAIDCEISVAPEVAKRDQNDCEQIKKSEQVEEAYEIDDDDENNDYY